MISQKFRRTKDVNVWDHHLVGGPGFDAREDADVTESDEDPETKFLVSSVTSSASHGGVVLVVAGASSLDDTLYT